MMKALCPFLLALLLPALAHAATFTVTVTNDTGAGSLRQAITDANAAAGADVIDFNIGTGLQTIPPGSALPNVTDPVTIDGTTQPGFAGVPLIELRGSGAGTTASGLRLLTTNCVLRGLVINRFLRHGLELNGGGFHVIEGCYLGLTNNGAARAGNMFMGLFISNSVNNLVGGTNAAARNVIAGNTNQQLGIWGPAAASNWVAGNFIGLSSTGSALIGTASTLNGLHISNAPLNIVGGTNANARNVIGGLNSAGIFLEGAACVLNQILGNYLGTDVTGTADIGNNGAGVLLNNSASSNWIGGAVTGAGNLISGNNGSGVQINSTTSTNNRVLGNLIGVSVTGGPLGNTGQGVYLNAARGNFIGGPNPGEGNVIAFSSADGVLVATGTHTNNAIRGNRIFSNDDQGIDLGTSGVTGNDALDADTGANQLQNFPVLTAATNSVSGTEIWGTLHSLTGRVFSVDFYANVTGDSSGAGEGQFYLGTTNVTTDASGNASFVWTHPVAALPGRFITATATDAFGNTSEFGTNIYALTTVAGATFTVTNTSDSGPGSLRAAIGQANTNISTGDTIAFDIPGAGPHTITPLSPLPVLFDPGTTIDGYTQPGAATNTLADGFDVVLKIVLDGVSAGTGDGLRFSGSNGVVRGLNIIRFTGDGIELATNASHTVIEGNVIGLDLSSADLGNTQQGVLVSGTCLNRIGGPAPWMRNVISGNNADGVELNGGGAWGNLVQGNFIGTDLTGTLDAGNSADGVLLDSAGTNTVGGASSGARNIIAGNNSDGVAMSGGSSNVVQGNYLGTDVTGTLDVGNSAAGVRLDASASFNLVGGAAANAGNVISGNNGAGVILNSATSTNNVLFGNFIGVDATGTNALGNTGHGVDLSAGRWNVIGGVSAGEGNVIAFSSLDGVNHAATTSTNNSIRGNRIFSNGDLGIDLGGAGVTGNDALDADTGANFLQNFPVISAATNSATNTIVLGTLHSATGRVFLVDFYAGDVGDASGHGEGRQYLGATNMTTDAFGNASFLADLPVVAVGRWITATATDPFGNTSEFSVSHAAVSLLPPVTLTVVNTNDSGAGSLRAAILANNLAASATPNRIEFNIPGPGPHTIAPLTALPALTEAAIVDGFTQSGSSSNTLCAGNDMVLQVRLDGVHTTSTADGLVLASPGGSTVRGLSIVRWDASSLSDGISLQSGTGHRIEGCFLGLDLDGTNALGNGGYGVHITSGARSNLIGGVTPGARNVISANGLTGVRLIDSPGNWIAGNFIGTDAAGMQDRGNSFRGVEAVGALSADLVIGGPGACARNVIAGNGSFSSTHHNIYLGSVSGALIAGNFVGLNVTGTNGLFGTRAGVFLENSSFNIIGGVTPDARNLISGQTMGIEMAGSGVCVSNRVLGNHIGIVAGGTVARPNTSHGILISLGRTNFIGGAGAGEGNVISGNGANGVFIASSSSSGNEVLGNIIGASADGLAAVPNSGFGMLVSSSARNRVGGTNAGEGNLIAFNLDDGVEVTGTPATNNAVLGNAIYSNGGLGLDLFSPAGVTANDTGDTDTGGNNLQNFPMLTRAAIGPVDTEIGGTLATLASADYRLEFFRNTAADPSGHGEGEVFLGATNVTTDGGGIAAFVFSTPGLLTAGHFITATATDTNGNTSEFSAARRLDSYDTADLAVGVRDLADPVSLAAGLQFTVTITNRGPTNAAGVWVTNTLPAGAAVLSVTPSQGLCVSNNGLVICDLGTLNDQAGADIALVLASPGPGLHQLVAQAAAVAADPDLINNYSGETIFAGLADLQITRVVTNAAPVAGQVFYYEVGVTNAGPDPATDAQLYYQVDNFNAVIAGGAVSQGSFSESFGQFTADFGTVPPGGTATLAIGLIPIEAVDLYDNGSLYRLEVDDVSANDFTNGLVTAVGGTGVVEFTLSPFGVSEGAGALAVTVRRVGGALGTMTVDFATTDLTALAGSDYTATNGTLVFTNGETQKIFHVALLNDLTEECLEEFALHLFNATGGAALRQTNVLARIFDNDFLAPGDLFLASRADPSVRVPAMGNSYYKTISADGRYVAFESSAANLVSNVTDYVQNIFVHDRASGTTVLASVSLTGRGGDSGSEFPQISGDGRAVLFSSDAGDLVTGDNNGYRDAFLRDLVSGVTHLLSVNTNGTGPGNSTSYVDLNTRQISTNGQVVVFASTASDLVPGFTDFTGTDHLYVRDLASNTTRLVTADLAGTGQASHSAFVPTLSEDGRVVAFQTVATNLVAEPDEEGTDDVFVRRLTNDTTVLVSVSTNGTGGNNTSGNNIFVSGDGRYVVFDSRASNLVTNSVAASDQVFWRDMELGVTRLVSVATNGASGNGAARPAGVSRDGRHVFFTSAASNLVPGDSNAREDAFLRDMHTDTTTLVSVNLANTGPGHDDSQADALSADARYLVFRSQATNLVMGTVLPFDFDTYVRDRLSGVTTLISRTHGTDDGSGNFTYDPVISSDADVVAYYSFAGTIVPLDDNGQGDVFAFDLSSGTNELISVGGGASGNDYSYDQVISSNGVFTAFASSASTLWPADVNGRDGDVFLFNSTNGVLTLVSVGLGGGTGNSDSYAPQVSATGRHVSFTSLASDLTASDVSNNQDIFLRDTVAGTTVLVSVNTNGVSGDGDSFDSRLTPDGRRVAFESYATDLTTNATGSSVNIFLRDLDTGVTEMISRPPNGGAPTGDSFDASLSADGRFVAFETLAGNLGPADTNSLRDVYVRDRLTGSNILCSVSTNGGAANSHSFDPIVSADGRYVIFESDAGDLVPGDNNFTTDIFAYEIASGTVQLVSATPGGGAGNSFSYLQGNLASAVVSADGRYVVFYSEAGDLTTNDTNALVADIFVRDLVAGVTTLISVNCAGTGGGSDYSYDPTISADGRYVAFESYATDLMPGQFEPNNSSVFRRDWFSGVTELISRNTAQTGGSTRYSYYALISANGTGVAFLSDAPDLVADDRNLTDDAFIWRGYAVPSSNCPPAIAAAPQDQSVLAGANAAFSVTADACGASFYQWHFNGTPIPGANGATLALPAVDSCDAGGYTVALTNLYGAVTSAVAVLTVSNAPAVLSPGGALAVATQLECASLTLAGGGAYFWNLTNATGAAGVDWDLIGVNGGVNVSATASNPFTIHLLSRTGGVAGPAANFDFNATSTWAVVTSTAPVTNFSAAAFAVDTTQFSNDLAGGVFSVEEGSLRLRFTPNHAPVAGTMSVTRAPNTSLKIKIAHLLTNTFDLDGDARALVSVGANSTNGVPVTFDGVNIFYPNATTNLADRLGYTVRDVRAAYRAGDTVRTASGFIDITVAAPTGTNFNIVSITVTGGVPTIVFAGIPNYAYDVQRSTNLEPPVTWTTLWTTNAPTNGLFHFTDLAAPTNTAFYRTAQP